MNDSEMNNGQSQPWSSTDVWAPGWYTDPWQAGRERRWTGNAWTEETRGATGPDISGLGGGPPASASSPFADAAPEPTPPVHTTRWTTRRIVTAVVALAVIALILGFTVTYVAADTSSKSANPTTPPTDNTPSTQPTTPNTTPSFGSIPGIGLTPPPSSETPPGASSGGSGNPSAGGSSGGGQQSTDPSANVLTQLVVRQADVTAPNTVQPSAGGDSVAGAATLDLCNGTFPSEAARTARLQNEMVDGTDQPLFSTEAVLYRDSKSTAQAFSELQSVVAGCPSSPVVSPVGEPTVATKFNAPPDTNWSQVPGVTRQAYDFTMSDSLGDSQRGVAVYLRRGRALLALYFQNPDAPQPSITGKTTMSEITTAFAQRLAAVPGSAIGA